MHTPYNRCMRYLVYPWSYDGLKEEVCTFHKADPVPLALKLQGGLADRQHYNTVLLGRIFL